MTNIFESMFISLAQQRIRQNEIKRRAIYYGKAVLNAFKEFSSFKRVYKHNRYRNRNLSTHLIFNNM